MTNREYMIALLKNWAFVDDGGASYEAMVYYNVACPYAVGDKRAVCREKPMDRENCYRCKEAWLDDEVDA